MAQNGHAQTAGNLDFDWAAIGKKQENYTPEERQKLDELYSQKLSTITDAQIVEGAVYITVHNMLAVSESP